MTEPTVQLDDLVHDHGQGPIFRIDDATIEPGLTVLHGPNGAGKTTLLRILATLLTPTRGAANVAGLDTTADAARVRAITGFVGHAPSLHPALTVSENLALHARLHGLPTTAIDQAIATWGLAAHAERAVAQLSYGQARRVDLARATLHDPQVLLLDEPTAGLDPAATQVLSANLAEARVGLVLLATHQAPPVDPDRTLSLGPQGLQEGGP